MKRTILVTGGAGNVGSALVNKLLENKDNYVVIADDLSTGDISKLPSSNNAQWRFVKCDVNEYRDIAEIMLSTKFNYAFHYAALVGVKRTQDNPVAVLKDIEGIKNVLGLCKNTGVSRVFFSSSSEVYGEPVVLPQNEHTTPLNSRVPYAIVKNLGEAYCKSYYQEYGLNYTIFRFFNTYGPNQSQDFVIAKFLKLAVNNEPITIYGDGSQTRTFCYVDDNVDTCVKTLYNDEVVNDVINIGGEHQYTILDLAEKVIKSTNSSSKIVFLPPLPDGDMTRRQPDNSKMIKVLNRNLKTLEEGILLMLQNESFLASIKK